MKKLLSLAVIGAAARWLFDPAQGESRRASLLQRVGRARGGVAGGLDQARDLAGGAVDTARETAGTVRETAADARDTVVARAADVVPGGGADDDPATFAGNPDDALLTDRVETELFRPEGVPKGDINVNVEFGKVVLRGQVESQEMIDDLVLRALEIDGVNDVENLLHTPGEPAPMHE